MGLIIQKESPTAAISQQIDRALRAQPQNEQELMEQRDELTAAVKSKVSFNWPGFLLAVAIFGALLAVAIWVDWKNLVDDPKVYSGFAGTALGAVLGYLTGEAVGTATSS
jgi:hypothetical protein